MKNLTRILSLIVIINIPQQLYSQYENLLSDNFNLFTELSYNFNFWSPDESTNLEYYTEGLQNLKLNAVLTHNIPLLPEIKFNWETNFNNQHQDELLATHNNSSSIENTYNKIMFVAGFGKHMLNNKFNPWISNNKFELSYTKETFFISVSPTEDNLEFASFNTSRITAFNQGERLSMFTKFEEVKATFNTNGHAVLPMLFTALFGGDIDEILELDGVDTRLGGYYSQFFKPYSVTQVSTLGNVSGNTDYIYNALFKSYGLVEQYTVPSEHFFFNMQLNLGLAEIELQQGNLLEDSSSPLFFYYKSLIEMGFHIPFAGNKGAFNLGGSFDWSFMWGGKYSDESEKIETTSFINNDMLFKAYGSLSYNF